MSLEKKYPFLINEKMRSENNKANHEFAIVPKIWLPYNFEINKNQCKVVHLVHEWCEKNKSRIPLLKSNPATMVSMIASHAYSTANVQQLNAISLCLIWTIILDDVQFESIKHENQIYELKNSYLKVFEDVMQSNRTETEDPILQLFIEFLTQLRPYMKPNHIERYRNALESYITASAEEARILRTSPDLSLEQFLKIRLLTTVFGIYELYVEIVEQIDMSTYLSDEIFVENKRAITTMITCLNDIYSYNKELQSDGKFNLVYQVQQHFDCTSEKAMNIVTEMYRSEEKIVHQTSIRLVEKHSANETMKKYVFAMQNWAIGNLLIYKYLPRYAMANRKVIRTV